MKIKINYAKISTQCIYLGQVYITHIKFDFSFFGDLSCYLGGQRKTGNTKPALGQKKGKVIFRNKNH